MPRVIDFEGAEAPACDLGTCVAALEAGGLDPLDEGSLLHAAHWLRRLGNDRDFLARLMLAELAGRHREEPAASAYGPQVIMLSPPGGETYLRANIWPLLEQGKVLPVIYKEFPLAEAAAAHRLMESSEHIGKIMLKVA